MQEKFTKDEQYSLGFMSEDDSGQFTLQLIALREREQSKRFIYVDDEVVDVIYPNTSDKFRMSDFKVEAAMKSIDDHTLELYLFDLVSHSAELGECTVLERQEIVNRIFNNLPVGFFHKLNDFENKTAPIYKEINEGSDDALNTLDMEIKAFYKSIELYGYGEMDL